MAIRRERHDGAAAGALDSGFTAAACTSKASTRASAPPATASANRSTAAKGKTRRTRRDGDGEWLPGGEGVADGGVGKLNRKLLPTSARYMIVKDTV